MKLKLDENNNAVLMDGKPVYVHEDGKEIPFDAAAAMKTIAERNAEAKKHREAKEAAETKLEAFKGIDDPETAKKAMTTVANLDAKKLIDAGEVEKMRQEAIKAVTDQYEAKLQGVSKERDEFSSALSNELIGGAFARSPLIVGDKAKLAIPADLVQAKFGSAFKVENGAVIGYNGQDPIYSRVNPGALAAFDEALEILVDQYPHRDSILRGSNAQGGGAQGGSSGASKTLSRTSFESKSPSEQMAFVKSGGSITD
jgi:hypothetical protein